MKKLILLMIILAISGICFGQESDTVAVIIQFVDSTGFIPDTLNDSSFTVGDSTLDSLFSVLNGKNGRGVWGPDTSDPVQNKFVIDIEADANTKSALIALANNSYLISLAVQEEFEYQIEDPCYCECVRKQYYSGHSSADDETTPEIHAFSDKLFQMDMTTHDHSWGDPVNISTDILEDNEGLIPDASEFWGACGIEKGFDFRAFDYDAGAGTYFTYVYSDGGIDYYDKNFWETYYLKFTPNGSSSHFRLSIFANDVVDIYIFNEDEYNFESMTAASFTSLVSSGAIPTISYDRNHDCIIGDDAGEVLETHILHAWFPYLECRDEHPGFSTGLNDYRDNYIGSVYLEDETEYTHGIDCDDYYDAWIETFDTEIDDYVFSGDWTSGSSFYLLLCPGDCKDHDYEDEGDPPAFLPSWGHSHGLFSYQLVEYFEPEITVNSNTYDCTNVSFDVDIVDADGYRWEIHRIDYDNSDVSAPHAIHDFSSTSITSTDPLVSSGTVSSADFSLTTSSISLPTGDANSYEFYIIVYHDEDSDGIHDDGECYAIERLAIIPTFYVDITADDCYCLEAETNTIANVHSYFDYDEDTYTYTWSYDGTTITSGITTSGRTSELAHTAYAEGTYTVVVSDGFPCSETETLTPDFYTPNLGNVNICYNPLELTHTFAFPVDLPSGSVVSSVTSSDATYTISVSDINLATPSVTLPATAPDETVVFTVTITNTCCGTSILTLTVEPKVTPTWGHTGGTCVDF